MLRTRIGNRIVPLTNTPVTFEAATADFGKVSLPAPEQARSAEGLRVLTQAREHALEMINRGEFSSVEVSRDNLDPEIRGEIEQPLLTRIDALERERDETKEALEEQKAECERRIGRDVEAAKAPLLDEIARLRREFESRESVIEARVKEAVEKVRGELETEVARRDEQLETLRKAADLPRSLEGVVLSSQRQLQRASEKIRQSGGAYA